MSPDIKNLVEFLNEVQDAEIDVSKLRRHEMKKLSSQFINNQPLNL